MHKKKIEFQGLAVRLFRKIRWWFDVANNPSDHSLIYLWCNHFIRYRWTTLVLFAICKHLHLFSLLLANTLSCLASAYINFMNTPITSRNHPDFPSLAVYIHSFFRTFNEYLEITISHKHVEDPSMDWWPEAPDNHIIKTIQNVCNIECTELIR